MVETVEPDCRGGDKSFPLSLTPLAGFLYDNYCYHFVSCKQGEVDGHKRQRNEIGPRPRRRGRTHPGGEEVPRTIVKAGLPPVAGIRELNPQQTRQYCEYWHIDPRGETLELACFSWKVREDKLRECWSWYGKRNRSEITPEEYRRRIHELAGVPLPEGTSSGDSGEIRAYNDAIPSSAAN